MVGRAVRPQTRPTERAGRSASATINRLAAQGFGRVSGAFRPQVAARFRWQQGRAAWQRQGVGSAKIPQTAPVARQKPAIIAGITGGKTRWQRGNAGKNAVSGGIRGQNRAKISRSGGKRSRSGAIPERFGSVRERFRCPDRRLWQGSLPVTDQEGPPAADKTAAGGGQLAVPDASARVTATTLSSELRSTYLL